MTNATLWGLGGSETATYTLAVELKRQGIDVELMSPVMGIVAGKLEGLGIKCHHTKDAEKLTKEKFDCIHIHHNHLAKVVNAFFYDIPAIYVCHGVVWSGNNPEKPPFEMEQIRTFVGVSEEIVKKMEAEGVKGVVVRNAVDMERFYPRKEINSSVKKILAIGNYLHDGHERIYVLDKASEVVGAEVIKVGRYWKNAIWETEELMNDVDMVIGYGRCAIEGMSCGRPVIVYGHNGNDGMVDDDTHWEIKTCNFSGRRYKGNWDVERMVEEIEKYSVEKGSLSRVIVSTFHDIKKIAKEYIELYEGAINGEDSGVDSSWIKI